LSGPLRSRSWWSRPDQAAGCGTRPWPLSTVTDAMCDGRCRDQPLGMVRERKNFPAPGGFERIAKRCSVSPGLVDIIKSSLPDTGSERNSRRSPRPSPSSPRWGFTAFQKPFMSFAVGLHARRNEAAPDFRSRRPRRLKRPTHAAGPQRRARFLKAYARWGAVAPLARIRIGT
jgi:hypothetical protein